MDLMMQYIFTFAIRKKEAYQSRNLSANTTDKYWPFSSLCFDSWELLLIQKVRVIIEDKDNLCATWNSSLIFRYHERRNILTKWCMQCLKPEREKFHLSKFIVRVLNFFFFEGLIDRGKVEVVNIELGFWL